jgi:hypothetical protein
MECGVEARDLREVWPQFENVPNGSQIVRLMQRRKWLELTQRR